MDDDLYEADGDFVNCRQVSGFRKFKTIVMVGDGNGNFTQTESNTNEFHKDCVDGEQEQVVSEGQDEVIEEGCTGDLCAETHLEERGFFYGCDVRSRNPYKSQNRLYGEGRFACETQMSKRLLYAKLCDNYLRYVDPCNGLTSKYVNNGGRNWTAVPRCIETPVTASSPLFAYKGTYTRAGIDPRRQDNGSNPGDRHLNSPETNVGFDCVISSNE